MALEGQTFSCGGVVFPLTPSTTNTLLRDGDPSCFYLIDFISSVIATHVGARWTAQATAAGRTETSAVATKVPYDPGPYLRSGQYTFPLLAVYRSEEVFTDRGSAFFAVETEWQVDYVLPAMSAADAERLLPMLRLVGAVVRQRIGRSQDDGYSASTLCDLAGFTTAVAERATFGAYDRGDDLTLPAVRLTVRTIEREGYVAGSYDGLSEARDMRLDIVTNDGTVADVVVVRVDTSRGFTAGFDKGYT